jgi:hypothetical protein
LIFTLFFSSSPPSSSFFSNFAYIYAIVCCQHESSKKWFVHFYEDFFYRENSELTLLGRFTLQLFMQILFFYSPCSSKFSISAVSHSCCNRYNFEMMFNTEWRFKSKISTKNIQSQSNTKKYTKKDFKSPSTQHFLLCFPFFKSLRQQHVCCVRFHRFMRNFLHISFFPFHYQL